jgi:hypothetical protein
VGHAAVGEEEGEEECGDYPFLEEGEVVAGLAIGLGLGAGGAGLVFTQARGDAGLGAEGGLAEAEVEGLVGADTDTVHALHAAGIDDHSVVADFLVDADVGGADGGEVAAALAGIGDADAPGGEAIGRGEEAAVGAGIGAVAL